MHLCGSCNTCIDGQHFLSMTPALPPPAWPCPPAAPDDDLADIRQRLQQKSEGNWTITFQCGSATKCGCPFELQLRHSRGSATVEVWEVERHQNHNPDSAEERAQRRQAGRPEGQHKVTALQPGRKRSSNGPLTQQDGSYGDEFKPQAKRGRTSEKVGAESIASWE
jgi:hypothetical protein